LTGWPNRSGRPWVYGHRGVRDSFPENTILAFEQSLKLGADGIEFDVQICKDGTLVVFHDSTLERMTGGKDRRPIADTVGSELCRVQLGQGATIPQFNDVLNWACSRQLYLNIELKTNGGNALELVSSVEIEIAESASPSLQARLLISSFDAGVISLANSHNWAWPFARLLGPDDQDQIHREDLARCGLHAHHSLVESLELARWTNAGKFINVWTVNTSSRARQLSSLTIDGIITDCPALVRSALE